MDKPNKSASVRGRLLFAFLGISMFSLVAAASGLYSLSQVGGALNKITEQRVPEALSWLEAPPVASADSPRASKKSAANAFSIE